MDPFPPPPKSPSPGARCSPTWNQFLSVSDLVDLAFARSHGNLTLHALSTKKSTPQELREIRALLDKLEGESA